MVRSEYLFCGAYLATYFVVINLSIMYLHIFVNFNIKRKCLGTCIDTYYPTKLPLSGAQ